MRWIALPLCAVALVACSKSENAAAKDTAAAPAVAPAPAPISMADLAGKWTVKTMNAANDSVVLTYTMTATADTTGWSMQFPDRKAPIPLHVRADADSVIMDAGPFPSALRKNVKVTVHGMARMQDGKLVGTTTAHYNVKTADSVTTLKTEGTKNP